MAVKSCNRIAVFKVLDRIGRFTIVGATIFADLCVAMEQLTDDDALTDAQSLIQQMHAELIQLEQEIVNFSDKYK